MRRLTLSTLLPSSVVLLLAVALVLMSCAPRWQKPGATEADFDAIKTVCENRSFDRFPKLLRQEQVDSEDLISPSISCSGSGSSARCSSIGSRYVPPTFRVVDDNETVRTQDYKSCLLENGWKPLKDSRE